MRWGKMHGFVCLMKASGVMGVSVCVPYEGIWCDGSKCACVPHEGIWCDGSKCVCALRASGIWCDVGSCRRVSGVMLVAVGGYLV